MRRKTRSENHTISQTMLKVACLGAHPCATRLVSSRLPSTHHPRSCASCIVNSHPSRPKQEKRESDRGDQGELTGRSCSQTTLRKGPIRQIPCRHHIVLLILLLLLLRPLPRLPNPNQAGLLPNHPGRHPVLRPSPSLRSSRARLGDQSQGATAGAALSPGPGPQRWPGSTES